MDQPKSKKSRSVDMSRELRAALLELRDTRLLQAFLNGGTSVADELVSVAFSRISLMQGYRHKTDLGGREDPATRFRFSEARK